MSESYAGSHLILNVTIYPILAFGYVTINLLNSASSAPAKVVLSNLLFKDGVIVPNGQTPVSVFFIASFIPPSTII